MVVCGVAELELYGGRCTDAAGLLEKHIASDLAAKDFDSAADGQATLALAQIALHKTSEAVATAAKAVANSRDGAVLFRAAQVYVAAGQEPRARPLNSPLRLLLASEPANQDNLVA